ncbi:MAG TPA: hypothetical protein VIR16_09065, partial [Candidatus Limnocylindrales bacterium]
STAVAASRVVAEAIAKSGDAGSPGSVPPSPVGAAANSPGPLAAGPFGSLGAGVSVNVVRGGEPRRGLKRERAE